MLSTRILELTVPCEDNGKRFVQRDRLDLIQSILKGSKYECFADLPLAKVYHHRKFRSEKPALLLSCHIDSLYDDYYAIKKGKEFQGTFDNSICNAIVVEAMLKALFPVQVLIVFTGDEEEDSQGADQTIRALKKEGIFKSLELVIVLDLTEEHFGRCHYTIENYFIANHRRWSLLRFHKRKDFKTYLAGMVDSAKFVKNGDPDETWQYDEYDLNCFTFCLPSRLLGEDMHDEQGVAILKDSPEEYLKALARLTHRIDKELNDEPE